MALDSTAKRLRWARERDGRYKTATDAARAFGWPVSTYLGHENGDRSPSRLKAKQYAKAYRVRWEWLLEGDGAPTTKTGTVPVEGYVGAGAAFHPFDETDRAFDPAPAAVEPNSAALIVRGTSMYPRYYDGEMIYYTKELRDPAELIGRECVIKVKGGAIYVKTIRRGATRGRFNLESYNAPLLEDQQVEWAAPVTWRRD